MPDNRLPPAKLSRALESIAAWRQGTKCPVACPVCGALGLNIIDRSTRPYAEWYALSCLSCGLDDTIHIPLSPPMPSYE